MSQRPKLLRRTRSKTVSHNPDTLVAVSAYAGDKGQVENNLPLYLHHECPVLILSPADAPITQVSDRKVHCQWFGQKGWIGKHTLERQVLFLEALLKFPHKYFLFHDADSICLSPRITPYLYEGNDVLWSNEVPDTNPGPSLLPKIALQPPYFFHRDVAAQLVAAHREDRIPTSYYGPPVSPEGWPMPFPTDCIDHYMLQLVYGSRVRHTNFLDGASFETVSPQGLECMSGLVRQHGKVFLHSVKTLSALDRLRVEHEKYCRNAVKMV